MCYEGKQAKKIFSLHNNARARKMKLYYLLTYLFLKDFIYLFMRDTERETET